MPADRILRVNDEIKRELSEILSEVKDPRVSESFISIMSVDTSRDLRNAKVYYSVFGGYRKKVEDGLHSAVGFIRKELAHRLNLRYTPELKFIYDETEEKSAKIEDLLRKIDEVNKKDG